MSGETIVNLILAVMVILLVALFAWTGYTGGRYDADIALCDRLGGVPARAPGDRAICIHPNAILNNPGEGE